MSKNKLEKALGIHKIREAKKPTGCFLLPMSVAPGVEYDETNCDYAYVNLSIEKIKKLLEYRKIAENLKKEYSDFNSLEFWDYTLCYINEQCPEKFGLNEDSQFHYATSVDVEAFKNNPRYEENPTIRVDYSILKLDETGLHWRACPKHWNVTMETETISWEDLEKSLAYLKKKG